MGFREMKEQLLRLALPFHVFFEEHVFTIVDGIGDLLVSISRLLVRYSAAKV